MYLCDRCGRACRKPTEVDFTSYNAKQPFEKEISHITICSRCADFYLREMSKFMRRHQEEYESSIRAEEEYLEARKPAAHILKED